MTGGRYLLNTNIAIPFLAQDTNIVGRFNENIIERVWLHKDSFVKKRSAPVFAFA